MRAKTHQLRERRVHRSFFRPLTFLALTTVLSFGIARGQALAQNTIWAWGWNGWGQLGNNGGGGPTPAQVSGISSATAIAVGGGFSLSVKNDGTVWAWGLNNYGQLGTAVSGGPTPMQISHLSGMTAIAAGESFGLAVKEDGTVWAWGDNKYGQIGHAPGTDGDSNLDGDNANSTPTQIAGLTGVISVAAGQNFSLALDKTGVVWAWGNNTYGELGHAPGADGDINGTYGYYTPTPVQITGLSGVIAIQAGYDFCQALTSAGNVVAWGNNNSGQLGIATNNGTTNPNPTPYQIGTLSSIVSIAAGQNFGLAAKNDGTVWAWGDNTYGELGNAGSGGWSPTQITSFAGAVTVAAGDTFSIAIKTNGTVWAWGDNYWGELGNAANYESHTPNPTPTQVSGLTGVIAIAGGLETTLAITHGINLFWQNTSNGQLAYWGLQYQSSVPVIVSGNYIAPGLAPPWRLVSASADFNMDGNPDLLWQNTQTGEVVVWYATYANGIASIVGGAVIAKSGPTNMRLAGVADFNGDGYPDLVWQNTSTGDISVWYMAVVNGVPAATGGGYIAHGVASVWSLAEAADFNGDGYPDFLWRNTSTGDVVWWQLAYRNGLPVSVGGGYIAKGFPLSWRLVGTADINGDGEPDLLWQNATTGQVSWWKLAYSYQGNSVSAVGGGYIPSSLSLSWMLAGGF